MVINPEDEEALKRSVNYPKRGIGDTTVQKILELSVSMGTSCMENPSGRRKISRTFQFRNSQKIITDMLPSLMA